MTAQPPRELHIEVDGDGNIIVVDGTINMPSPVRLQALHQLRPGVKDFVGRTREIEQITRVLCQTNPISSSTVVGIWGIGGMGKTTLSNQIAQQLCPNFSAAQIIVDLRGTSDEPKRPEQALREIIQAFEPQAQLPNKQGDLENLYQSVLHGKQAIILADDARDADQVRPLIPPEGCVFIVTSRERILLNGMVPVELLELSPVDAKDLLLYICPQIGAAASRLANLCDYLPLALRVSATLLSINDTLSVETYLTQLEDQIARLKHLTVVGDASLNVEASLHMSYALLEPAERQALHQASVFGAVLVATHPRQFGRQARVVIPEHFEAVFARKPRARIMVYRDWLLGLSTTAADYISLVCRKRYAEMDDQITALYTLAQQLDREAFLAAVELAADQQTIGAEYVSALAAQPRPRPARHGADDELRLRLADVPPQRAIERDLAQYEQYVANRDLSGAAVVGGAA